MLADIGLNDKNLVINQSPEDFFFMKTFDGHQNNAFRVMRPPFDIHATLKHAQNLIIVLPTSLLTTQDALVLYFTTIDRSNVLTFYTAFLQH